MMADGAVGIVMTTPDLAGRRNQQSVRIVGTGGCVSHYSLGQETDLARLGWPRARWLRDTRLTARSARAAWRWSTAPGTCGSAARSR